MKRLSIISALTVMGITACLAETHTYKGKEVPEGVIDSSSSCGVNIEKLEECIKNRAKGEGEGICNDLKLYAVTLSKVLETSEELAKINEKDSKHQMLTTQRQVSIATLKILKENLMKAGIEATQLSNILPLKRGQGDGKLQCK